MGDSEAGAGEIHQQVSWNLQRWEQTQTFHSNGPHRMSTCGFLGKMEFCYHYHTVMFMKTLPCGILFQYLFIEYDQYFLSIHLEMEIVMKYEVMSKR